MSSQIEVSVLKFIADAKQISAHPPDEIQFLEEIFSPMMKCIADVNIYSHALLEESRKLVVLKKMPEALSYFRKTSELVYVIEDLIYSLYFETICDKYTIFSEVIRLKTERDASGCMAILLMISYLTVISDSLNVNYLKEFPLNDERFVLFTPCPNAPREVRMKRLLYRLAPISMTPFIRKLNLCIDDTKDVSEYTVEELLKAAKLVATNWHLLDASPQLLKYLLGILHRGCLFMSRPAREKMHGMRIMRKYVKTQNNEHFFSGNYDMLRRLSGGITQMIIIVRYRLNIEVADIMDIIPAHVMKENPNYVRERCDGINKALVKTVRQMENAPTLAREMREIFNSSAITFGDLDMFVEKCNSDPQHPMDVIFNTKPQETQHAFMVLNQSVDYIGLCKIREDTSETIVKHYHKMYTFAQNYYSRDLKMYIAETFFKPQGCNLFTDYFLIDVEFVDKLPTLMGYKYPVVISMLGKNHVVYKNRIYLCTSIEHALFTWCMIIRHAEKSEIKEVSLDCYDSPCISNLLGETNAFRNTTGWGNKGKVTEGTMEDF